MTYAEAIQFLQGLQMFGTNFGLENTFKLAALAGNPQNQLRFIHVAGTNGKGSTCAMLESIYRASGLRVGLFTSPHLVSFRERIQINRQLISESEVARLVMELRGLQSGTGFQPASDSKDAHPALFELATVMALKYFRGTKMRPGDLGNRPRRPDGRDKHRHAARQCHHQYRVRSSAMAGRHAGKNRGGKGGHHQAGESQL